ncbi:hypothetical protein MHK_010124 [Candidatus Magnetomorum sp. HK-1]|nr:hypothetical protein MHK_010124 [Candidatus Magnetomorum sp. HK-1]
MAKYEHLPIYKKAMELSIYTHNMVQKFSRYNKYAIGADIRQETYEIIKLIVRANTEKQKIPILKELVLHCEMFKNMLILAKEVKAFQNFSSFQQAASMASVLCKQSQGWLNSTVKNSQNHQPPKSGR